MLGPSAEESEKIATEHLRYLERLAKFSLDLNMYGIPIVQETFQKLVSITGTRRFFQRAEAFERFLSMLSRTINSNYYLNRQHEDMNFYNTSTYGYTNYDYDYGRRLQIVNNENIYQARHIRNSNDNMNNVNAANSNDIHINSMNMNMNINRYIRQPYAIQRRIPQNDNLNNIEEEEEEKENDHESNNNLTINSERSSTLSIREDYSLYASSSYHHQRSHPPNYENYITRVHYSHFQRNPSHMPENRNRNLHHSNINSNIKINNDVYPENNHNPVSNPIPDRRSHFTTNTNSNFNNDNNNNKSSNSNIDNSNNDDNTNIDVDKNNNSQDISNLNKEELKYNIQSYKNIDMKLYEDLNILTPPTTNDDNGISLKDEKKKDNQKLNDQIKVSHNSEVNDLKAQNSLIIPPIEQQKNI